MRFLRKTGHGLARIPTWRARFTSTSLCARAYSARGGGKNHHHTSLPTYLLNTDLMVELHYNSVWFLHGVRFILRSVACARTALPARAHRFADGR